MDSTASMSKKCLTFPHIPNSASLTLDRCAAGAIKLTGSTRGPDPSKIAQQSPLNWIDEVLLLVTRVKQQEFCAHELDLAWRSRRKWSKAWHVSRQDHVRPEAFREDPEGAYQAHKSRLANQGNEMGGWVNSLNSPFLWSTSNPLD